MRKGSKTRLLVALGVVTTDRHERDALWTAAATLRGNLVAAAMATVLLKAEAIVH